MTTTRLAIVGLGNMGAAIATGLIDSAGVDSDSLILVESDDRRAEVIRDRYGVDVIADVAEVRCEDAILAVLPQDVRDVCRALVGVRRVVSVAAGIPMAVISMWLDGDPLVFRAMPNTPSEVGAGTTGLAIDERADEADAAWATMVMQAVGSVEVVPEAYLDAVTGVAGSGVGFLYLVAEALIDGGVFEGLPRPLARRLVAGTFIGAGEMLRRSPRSEGRLRSDVATPGGTTAAGLRVLEDQGVRSALGNAVTAAANRSKELSGGWDD